MSTESLGRFPGRAFCASALFAFLILGASLALARNVYPPQSSPATRKDYALIYGTVWGPDDRPLAGVPIKIRRVSAKKANWELVSDRNGEFAQRVPIGTYDYVIVADIKMPKGQPKPQTTAHIDNNERTDVGLHLTEQMLPSR